MSHKPILLALAALLAFSGSGAAQEHMMGGDSGLPEACKSDAPMPDAAMMAMPEGMGEAQKAMGAGMARMNADMAMGMMAEDADIAFVCSMIPHHQGAIDMAKAELAHGDDPWAKELAQKVIAAQEQEIKDMIAWLEQQGQ
jgi:uncharacterized protein (DUF305 family)